MRLDLETRPHHAAADAAWRELLVDDVSEADYAAQLARVYGFEGPLEAAFAYTPGLVRVIDVRRRQRAGLIAQDLLALDVEPAQIANLPGLALAPFATIPEALGWMYVVERATPRCPCRGNAGRHRTLSRRSEERARPEPDGGGRQSP